MRLPPGVSASAFASAIAQWRSVVGREWVFTSDEDLDLYRDAYSPFWGEAQERIASAAVAPDSVEQVQAVVRIANALKIPLYPISTGKNLTYGGSAPVLSGSVVLDLKRMNRILEVSEKNAFALVEPGVSYFDLYRHIRENKLNLWIDCPDPGWGGLVGNSLDRGAGYTAFPYRDHFEAHCGMEVVLANGEVVRTGMGALPEAETWQQFKYGMGPLVDGLFSQSNFGVVTKMGFWLMPQPEAALPVTVTAPRYSDLIPLADTLISLMYQGLIHSHTSCASPLMTGPADPELTALRARWDDGRTAAMDDYARRKGVPGWMAPFVFYGPEAVIRSQWEHVKSKLSAAVPGVSFSEAAPMRFPLEDEQVLKLADPARVGVPSLSYFASRQGPDQLLEGHMDFSPVVPMDGAKILQALHAFGKLFDEVGVQPLGGLPLFYHRRTATIIYAIPTSRDPAFNSKAREAFARGIALGAAHGWGEYRIHPAFMDTASDYYSFNNHALKRLHDTLKDAIDQNGILSAGRYGIWPRALRGRGRPS